MKIIKTLSKTPFFIVFLLAALIPHIPNINFHLIGNYFTTYNISRVIILIYTGAIFFGLINNQKSIFLNKKLLILVVFYFITQSLSILGAQNISSFLSMYKDIAVSILIFFITYLLVNKKNFHWIIPTLVLFTTLSLFCQFIIYFFPTSTKLFHFFLDSNYLKFFDYQSNRNRFFGNTFDEAFIPILVLGLFFEKKYFKQVWYLFLLVLTSFFVFISGWRTKALMFIFAFFSSLFFLKLSKKGVLIILVVLGFITLTFNKIPQQIIGTNIIDRLFFDENGLNEQTISGRLELWQESLKMGIGKPLTGVGLGNFYDNLDWKLQSSNNLSDINRYNNFILIDDPHNLFLSTFAASGTLGITSLFLLILYFMISDLRSLKYGNKINKSLIIFFWTYFIYALINPWIYFSYLAIFWLVRGIIEKFKIIYINENK